MTKQLRIAVVGNPNVGKSSLINAITGTHLHVGNWPGVTVEKKLAILHYQDSTFHLVDLPGVYSLQPFTQEEFITRDYLLNDKPDVILQVIDTTNIERNLYLTVQLLELDIPVVICLNIVDEAKKKGIAIHAQAFSQLLNVTAVSTVATKKKGLKSLLAALHAIEQDHAAYRPQPLAYADDLQALINQVQDIATTHYPQLLKKYPALWLACKLLAQDKQFIQEERLDLSEIQPIITHLEDTYQEDSQSILATAKYKQAATITKKVVNYKPVQHTAISEHLDKLLLHKYLSIPFFLLTMWLVFKLTFDLATPFVDWVGYVFTNILSKWVSGLLHLMHAPPWFESLINEGGIYGVCFVLTFIPIIFAMMFCLTFLEASGYMARIAFIMDRLMQSIGLQGKAFISLLLGFGCNVPAIYATRTLFARRDRILTAMIIPFMSCSARMPVYILFVAAFFPAYPSLILLSLYVFGMFIAVIMGLILNKLLTNKEESLFIMELPPYRLPTLKNLLIHTWVKCKHFLTKAGTYIFAVSILVWFLLHMPWGVEDKKDSYLGQMAQVIAPVFKPLGFGNWQAASSLITGVIAKEIVISTMGEVYSPKLTNLSAQPINISQDIANIAISFGHAALQAWHNLFSSFSMSSLSLETNTSPNGLKQLIQQQFTPLSALSFMIFVLLYMPCVVTGIATKNEFGTWKWFGVTSAYSLAIAWLCSFLIYQLGSLL